MSISAVKLNENGDQCDTSSSKVTPREITGVMPLVLPAFSKTFGWSEVGCVLCFRGCQLRSPFCQGSVPQGSSAHGFGTGKRMCCDLGLLLMPRSGCNPSPNPYCGPSSDCCCPRGTRLTGVCRTILGARAGWCWLMYTKGDGREGHCTG